MLEVSLQKFVLADAIEYVIGCSHPYQRLVLMALPLAILQIILNFYSHTEAPQPCWPGASWNFMRCVHVMLPCGIGGIKPAIT